MLHTNLKKKSWWPQWRGPQMKGPSGTRFGKVGSFFVKDALCQNKMKTLTTVPKFKEILFLLPSAKKNSLVHLFRVLGDASRVVSMSALALSKSAIPSLLSQNSAQSATATTALAMVIFLFSLPIPGDKPQKTRALILSYSHLSSLSKVCFFDQCKFQMPLLL